jgi:hypothetical protein
MNICHYTLLGDMATLGGVARDQGVHDNVSFKYFGTHAQVNTKPLRWHDTLALYKGGFDPQSCPWQYGAGRAK